MMSWGDQRLQNWRLVDAANVQSDGAALSMTGVTTAAWTPAVVPGTVLTSLVRAGRYPEPLYGLNNLAIPESLSRASYWYRTEFDVPRSSRGRHTWLRFDGVNYVAEVWVGGHAVGTVRGAFARGLFDVTPWVKPGRRASVAVKILPPNHPGIPHEQSVAGGTGQNGGVTGADGVTFAATIGWDWIPGIRDRDMGIWQDVTLLSTGSVTLHDPSVRTDLPLPRRDLAGIAIGATLRNETGQPQAGTLLGSVEGTKLAFRLPVTLTPGETKEVAAPSLRMTNPRLWWPNGYGKPDLYRLRLRFVQGKVESDATETQFGVREMGYFKPGGKEMTIHVNGVPVSCRGGNWGMDEAMKRSPADRLDAQLRMHRDANLNMVRNWVGQSTQEDFYAACDKYGILVWDDFWLANPADGPDPDDDALFLANAKEKLLRFRNHPSIALWCGRNEGVPPPALNEGLARLVSGLDPTRFYQPDSADTNGVTGHGPYGNVPFAQYFGMVGPFHTEMGAPSIPTLESIRGMMPEKDLWPINDDWAYHDFTRGAQRGDRYPGMLSKRYGPVAGFKDFVRKGAAMTYETYRAMFEGRNAHLFAPNSGTLLWMTNPAQPSFVWQLYHHDLDPTAAMFGTKVANEPVHVQMTPDWGEIQIINTTPDPIHDATLESTVFFETGEPLSRHSFKIDVPASGVWKRHYPADTSMPPMVRLRLYDAHRRLLSENLYWSIGFDDARSLDALPRVALVGEGRRTKTGVKVTLRNPSKTVALLTHLSLRHRDGSRVLPAFYSDNFVHVFPGESRTITIDADVNDPLVMLDGWNLAGVEGPGLALNVDAQPEPPTSIVARPALPGTLISIDCGGADVAGSPWNPDEAFAVGGNEETQNGTVVGSDLPAEILNSERWGESVYRIPLPAGKKVRVRLVFAEMSQFAPRARRFGVEIDGKRVLDDFDIAAEAGGPFKALTKEFPVEVDASGKIVVAFRKGAANEPEIRAIQILTP